MPVSGAFCSSSIGWQMVYYLFGILTLIFFSIFFAFYRDSPTSHKNVSEKEINKIKEGRLTVSDNDRSDVPYLAILTDIPVIGIGIICFGGCLGFQILFQFGPIYLNQILGFSLESTGFMAALPYVLATVVKFFAGPFSNMFTCLSEKGKIVLFATMSQFPMCVCFVLMATLPVDMLWLIQIAFTLVNSFAGLAAVGIAKSVQLVSCFI